MDAPARSTPPSIACDPQLTLTALRGLPLVEPGDDLVELLDAGLSSTGVQLRTCDVLVVTSKILSRAEGCFTDLAQVKASRVHKPWPRNSTRIPPWFKWCWRTPSASAARPQACSS